MAERDEKPESRRARVCQFYTVHKHLCRKWLPLTAILAAFRAAPTRTLCQALFRYNIECMKGHAVIDDYGQHRGEQDQGGMYRNTPSAHILRH